MRRILLLSAIFIVTIPFRVGSINYKNKEMTLISFSINIHPETKKYLEHFESYFSPVKNSEADKIIAKIKEQTWSSLVDILQLEVGMVILPISTFGNKISYDVYGFPDVNISKAQRKGFSKFYMKVELQIDPELLYPISYKSNRDSISQPIKLKTGEIKPVVTITLTTYPKNGIIPIGKYVGISEAPTVWTAEDASILDGLVNADSKTDFSTLMSLINEAINDLSINVLVQ